MKVTGFISLIVASLTFCISAYAGDAKSVGLDCEKAIAKAEIMAAHRKWWSERPDPKSPVLNIRTHANFAKDLLLPMGAVFSHEKVGALTFEDQNGECLLESTGHPADVVLDDLVKSSAINRSTKDKSPGSCENDNPLFSVDCHGHVKTATASTR